MTFKLTVKSAYLPILLILMLLSDFSAQSQGRLLRGEIWQDYSLTDKKADFYVSNKGNDAWSGTIAEPNGNGADGPFATLQRAQKAVRELKSKLFLPKKLALDKRYVGSPHKYGTGKDILVLLRGGIYPLDSTLRFNSPDGGERIETELPTGAFEYHQLKDYFVTYASYPGEKAILSGAERITGWKKSADAKWQVQLKEQNIKELFANGKRQTLARSPNTGYFYTDGQPTDPGVFSFKPGDLHDWKDLTSGNIHLTVRWGAVHTSLTRVDEKLHKAYLKDPDEGILNVPPRYYFENLEALLDTAGEWYFNQKTKILSFLPETDSSNPNEAILLSPKTAGLVAASGTREKPIRNLRFYNLTFTATAPGDRGTLDFTYAKNCEVLRNTIENVSQAAIYFGLGNYHNLIGENILRNITGSGIAVLGNPQPENWNDLVSDNRITRNEISNLRPATIGIRTANALRTTIAHNYITNTGSYGITVGSWPNVEESSDGSHLVEFNHLSFTNMARDDEGAIAVYGLSPGSVVRENLIHDVKPATTNENVGLFLQNMASGWSLTNNILYGLKQAEMKLCAAYLENNTYENNHLIERPLVEPEKIIEGSPRFSYRNLQVISPAGNGTGHALLIRAEVSNDGSTGNQQVPLYVDGKEAARQLFPVISKNYRQIEFNYQFFTPGKHSVSIGTTDQKLLEITGDTIRMLYSQLATNVTELPSGDSVRVGVMVKSMKHEPMDQQIDLFVDGKSISSKQIHFQADESKLISFGFKPETGTHSVTIGNHPPLSIRAFPLIKVNFSQRELQTFCSSTAKPCSYEYSVGKNSYTVIARGTDFLHAEDSYGTIFLPKMAKGNFVATVKVVELGKEVSDWFRFGIFVRNNLDKTNRTDKDLAGSFLVFSTPKRSGTQWDEFGDGSTHNSRSLNYTREQPFPLWLKMVRHGDRLSGYYSFDGKSWILSRESGNLSGIAQVLDIGLAAGTNDQKPSTVKFEDFQLWLEQ